MTEDHEGVHGSVEERIDERVAAQVNTRVE